MPKIVLYHGSPVKFENFEVKNLPSSIEQEGPGIYLTTSEEEATRYSEGVYVYKVEWSYKKLLSSKSQSKVALKRYAGQVRKAFLMMDKSRLETILESWGENQTNALNNIIETCIDSAFSEKDIFLNVWAEGYMKKSAEFCAMMTALGYDGQIIEFDDINHVVAFNPANIKILEIKNKSIVESILYEAFVSQNVKSSNIFNIGYDKLTSTLRIIFHSGDAYDYFNVPATVFSQLKRAKSKGSFAYHNICHTYSYEKVE